MNAGVNDAATPPTSPQYAKVARLMRQRREQEPPSSDPRVLRDRLEAVALPVEGDVTVTELELGGVRVERVAWGDVGAEGGVLFLHGGGFCLGSPRTHRKLAADVSRSVGLPCFVVDYRLMVPGFDAPYVVAHVVPVEASSDTVRVTTNILNCPIEKVHIDMPVTVLFEEVAPGVVLPQFEPSATDAASAR